MPWCKLDDGMGEHRKTRRVIRAGGLGAFGLHALALLHASRYLTDGWVEAEFVDEMCEMAGDTTAEKDRMVAALVQRGVWEPADTGDGWWVHDYLEYNPTRAKVEEQRRADAERKAEGRARAAARTRPATPAAAPAPGRAPGELPRPAKKHRRAEHTRADQQRYADEMATLAAELFPGDPGGLNTLAAAIHSGRATTVDQVREYAARHAAPVTSLADHQAEVIAELGRRTIDLNARAAA